MLAGAMQPEKLPAERRATLFVVAGAATAIVSIPLAAAAGAPYLSFGSHQPVAGHLRDRAVRGPVRDPVPDPRTDGG